MKIGLNSMGFWPGRVGGVETYFRNLVNYLQRLDNSNNYTILCDEPNVSEFSLVNPQFKMKVCNYRKPSIKRLLRSGLRRINVDILRAEPRYLDFDVVHHPFTTMKPEWSRFPSVLTFHDMQHEFYPEFFSPKELHNRRQSYRSSAESATRVIAISEYSKKTLIDRFDIPAEKIDVIYQGYSANYRVIDNKEQLNAIKKKYGLDKPFIYFPAATWPHKNHKNLLIAMKLLKERYRFEGMLVLTGVAQQFHGETLDLIEKHGLVENVSILGYLPYGELPCLYNMARIMVFPSLFEGFGIPLVEAMACGCPVVCSDSTSLPEVVGDAGVKFDPNQPEEIASRIWEVWQDDGKIMKMKAAGIKRVKLFSWEKAAQKTLDVYNKAII